LRQAVLVFLGSGLGGTARYLLGTAIGRVFGTAFPYGTIAINAIGSFLILIVVQLAAAGRISQDVRLALATGVLGGFTTYSSFNLETFQLAQQGSWGLAALNFALTTVLCLGAGLAGWWVAS
jgi:CrcB protein